MEELLEKFKNKLSSHNYKLTEQRKDILKVLIRERNRHFSADDLYTEVKRINPDVGLATIYRNLELFCRLGITYQLDFDSSFKYYELNVDEKHHHHHLVCMQCGRIIEFNDEVLEEFEEKLEDEHSFDIVEHRIKFYGICRQCREGEEKDDR